tara:strand:- start:757 stop:2103 length:1347 start_codon:yes stop_codon:yes gene_type:complete
MDFEKFVFKKISLWILLLTLIFGSISSVLFGWVVFYMTTDDTPRSTKIGNLAIGTVKFTDTIIKFIDNVTTTMDPRVKEFNEFENLKIFDANFKDDGYILFSSINLNREPVTWLYDLKSQKKIYQWKHSINEIVKKTETKNKVTKCCYRAQHPLLLKDGSIVTNSSDGPLVKINRCSIIDWIVDRNFHHSNERGPNNNFITPTVTKAKPDKKFNPTIDHGYAIVNEKGKIIEEVSVIDILEKNGYMGLLYGVGKYDFDRIHLNDAEYILESDQFVKKGDIMFSSRSLSSVFLYRPSTDKIIWLETGPWLVQHDVDYQGNGIFTIFSNGAPDGYSNLIKENLSKYKKDIDKNLIYEYNMETKSKNILLDLSKLNIFTGSEGLHKILKNGDVFVEETGSATMHRISKDGRLRWSFVNTLNENLIGSLHWSRYYNRKDLNLNWIKKDCEKN